MNNDAPMISSGGSSAQAQDETIDLGALLNVVKRHLALLLICIVLFAAGGVYYAFKVAVPIYTSVTTVVLDTTPVTPFADLQNVVSGLSGDSEEVKTEIEVLRSRRLMGKVVDRLDLIRDPEFNKELLPLGAKDRLMTKVRTWLGIMPQQVTGDPEIEARILRDTVITQLLSQVGIANVPQSLVFNIAVTTETALKSTRIADAIAETYILDQITLKFEETEKATQWLTERVSQFQVDLENAQVRVSRFSASTELVSLEMLQLREVQLKDLRDRIADIERILPETGDELTLQRQKARLETLRASEQTMALQLADQNDDLIKLQQLQREAESIKLLYEYFLGRLKETRAQQGIQQADSRVLSAAVIPHEPSAPKKPVIVITAGLFGLLVGGLITALLENRKVGLRSARDLEQRFGYSVLGQIPLIPVRGRDGIMPYLINKPTSAAAEAYRNLRTSLMLANPKKVPKIIISTSSIPGEGKTTNSLGLAHNLIGVGKNVLLMEGDIRRFTLNQHFAELKDKKGLISVMMGEATLDEALLKDEQSGLWVLGGDQSPLSAADIFSSEKFQDLMELLKSRFDVIVIDCPPVLAVPDARILSNMAESATIFSVKWDRTSQFEIEESLRIYHTSGQKITGFILGQINLNRMKSYGQYGQYGAYANYGTEHYHS